MCCQTHSPVIIRSHTTIDKNHTYIMNALLGVQKAFSDSLRKRVVYTTIFMAAMNIIVTSQAAVFTAGFETSEGYDNSAPANVSGQKGWTINEAATDQLSFFQFLGSGTNNAAGLGGLYGDPLVNRVVLGHGVNTSLNNTRVNLSLNFVASTLVPGRDSFSVIFDNDNDPENVPQFSIAFEPDPTFTDRLNIVWYDALNARTSSLNAIFYGGLYDLSVAFDASGADTLFSARVEDSLTNQGINFNGTLDGASTASLANLGVGFTLDPAAQGFGDNFMLFDDVVVSKGGAQSVPETGAGLAWLAVLGVLGMGRVFVSGRSRTA